MPDESGRLRLLTDPSLQLPEPFAGAETTFCTQVEVAVPAGFGIGSGGPKKQPVSEQLRLLPVWAAVRGPIVIAPETLLQLVIAVRVVAPPGTRAGSGTPS